jgi:hypothetical protein
MSFLRKQESISQPLNIPMSPVLFKDRKGRVTSRIEKKAERSRKIKRELEDIEKHMLNVKT